MEYIDWLFIFYISGTSFLIMFGLYLPFLIWVGYLIYRRLNWSEPVRLSAIVIAGALVFLVPVFDVIKTGLDMHYYCNNEHGEHVYETVTTNSIYGELKTAREYMAAGFEFVEAKGLAGKLTRFEIANDKLMRTLIESPISEYEVTKEYINLDNNIRLTNVIIVNRGTQEILGETKSFIAKYGWLDRVTPDLGSHAFRCFKPRVYGSHEFVLKVLRPAKN